MEKIQSIGARSIAFKAETTSAQNLQSDNKEKNIKDGNKKSMDALKWAGIIGAGALAIGGAVYAIKKGKTIDISNIEKENLGKFLEEKEGFEFSKGIITKNGEKWNGTVIRKDGLRHIYKDGQLVKAIKKGDKGFTTVFNRNEEGVLQSIEKTLADSSIQKYSAEGKLIANAEEATETV